MNFFIFGVFQNFLQLEQTSYKKMTFFSVALSISCILATMYDIIMVGWSVRQSIIGLIFCIFIFFPAKQYINFVVMWTDLIFVTCFSIKGYVCLSVCPSIGLSVPWSIHMSVTIQWEMQNLIQNLLKLIGSKTTSIK